MLFQQEMRTFQKPVTRQDGFETRSTPQDRRVISDAQLQFALLLGQKIPGNLLHQFVFIAEMLHDSIVILTHLSKRTVDSSPGTVPKKKNTGLTRHSTETNMQGVANRGSRFRSFEVPVVVC